MRLVSGCQSSATSRPSVERTFSSSVCLLAISSSWVLYIATAASHRWQFTEMRLAGVFATVSQRHSVRRNEPAKGEARRGSGLHVMREEREWLGDVTLDQRVRELPLAAHDLEAVALEVGGARASVPKRLALRDQLAKPFRELLDL